jgi:hypothetical protein
MLTLFVNAYNHISPLTPDCKTIKEHLIFFLLATDDSSIVSSRLMHVSTFPNSPQVNSPVHDNSATFFAVVVLRAESRNGTTAFTHLLFNSRFNFKNKDFQEVNFTLYIKR